MSATMASAATTLAASTARRRSCAWSFFTVGGRIGLTQSGWRRGSGLARTEPSGIRRKVSR
jgi:hypothetical protein